MPRSRVPRHETITLFDNRATKATYVTRADGKYDVTIEANVVKLRASDVGAETEIPVDDPIDFGVLGKDDKVLTLEREHVTSAHPTFTLTVEGEPVKAGIDPMNKLINRKPDDNVMRVERASDGSWRAPAPSGRTSHRNLPREDTLDLVRLGG